ncbi:MAG: acyl-CoA thioesterase [Roseivirga sp.]|nr:acyl-CoA thioesterase [Roseivirga sp.]
MNTSNKNPESERLIRFQDCDPFGHLNNSKYIDYMINVREDHLVEEYDLNVFLMAHRDKRSWIVGQNEIAYLKPSQVMEKVIIQTRLIDFTERYVQAEMVMYDAKKTHVKAVLWTKFFHFDFSLGKAVAHTEELMKMFGELHIGLPTDRVEERAKQLSKDIRKSEAICC